MYDEIEEVDTVDAEGRQPVADAEVAVLCGMEMGAEAVIKPTHRFSGLACRKAPNFWEKSAKLGFLVADLFRDRGVDGVAEAITHIMRASDEANDELAESAAYVPSDFEAACNRVVDAIDTILATRRERLAGPYYLACGISQLPRHINRAVWKEDLTEAVVDCINFVCDGAVDHAAFIRLTSSLTDLPTEAQRQAALVQIENMLTGGSQRA